MPKRSDSEPLIAQVARQVHQHLSLAGDVITSNRALRDVLVEADKAVEVGEFAVVTDRLNRVAEDLEGQVDPTLQATGAAMDALQEFSATLDAFTAGFDRIRERTEEIMRVTAQIAGVAKQSSLLALNARIEAHRAGHSGAGFRVVAEEFGKLSQRTHSMSEEVGSTIRSIQQALGETSAQVQQQFALNRASLDRAHTALKTVDTTANQMAAGTVALGQVVAQVEQIAYRQVALADAFERMQRHNQWVEQASTSLLSQLQEAVVEADRLWAEALPAERQPEVASLQRFEERFYRAMRESRSAEAAQILQEALQAQLDPSALAERLGAAAGQLHQESCGPEPIETVFRNSRILEDALAVLEPMLEAEGVQDRPLVLLGNVFEDYHDLGRRLVAIALRAAGFRVVDLGNSVANEDFVSQARALRPALVGVSAHLLHTAKWIPGLRQALAQAGLSEMPLIAGGAPFLVDPELGERFGVDGVGRNPQDAVRIARFFTARRERGGVR